MPEHHPAIGFVKLFPSEDIPRIIQNIQSCCKTLSRKSPYEKENDLSKRLYLQLLRFPEYHTGPIEPHMESWVVDMDDDEPEITGRADIKFICGRGVETYFAVEAKRLFITYPKGGKASLIMDYINDGMMRYVSGQYASKMTDGAMLGYVFDNDLPNTKKVLAEAVHKQAVKLQLAADGFWQESTLAVIPPIDETKHSLANREFTIFHILANV